MKIWKVKQNVQLQLIFAFMVLLPMFLMAHEQDNSAVRFKPLDSLIIQQITNDELVGAELLIMKNDDVLFHKAYGWKNKEEGEKMKTNTVFNIRSMTKLFTATVIHQLISEGKLSRTDKVKQYVQGFNNSKSSTITIHQLLTHTSGLPISIIQDFDNYENLKDLANRIGESEQIMNTIKFRYSDAGYDVLGAIIEVVCSKPIELVFKERIFDKIGMKDTYALTKNNAGRNEQIASLYGNYKGSWTRFWNPNDTPFYNFTLGAQSFYATPMDYSRFMSIFINNGKFHTHQLLSQQAVNEIVNLSNEYKLPVYDISYESGFSQLKTYMGESIFAFTNLDEKVKVIGSGGSDGTFSWVFVEDEIVVSFFSQSRKKGVFPMKPIESVLQSIFFQPVQTSLKNLKVYDPHIKYIGSYTSHIKPFDQGVFKISSKDSVLSVFIPGQMDFELNKPVDDEWSFKVSPLVSINFKEKGDLIEGFYLNQKVNFEKRLDSLINRRVADAPSIYTGEYKYPQYNMTSTISFEDEVFYLELVPGQKSVIEKSADHNYWIYKNDKSKRINFEKDAKGNIKNMIVTSSIFVAKEEP